MISEHEVKEVSGVSELSQEGYRLLKHNMLDEAEARFRMIIESDEHNSYALVGLGDVTRKRGDYRAASGFYQECLNSYPKNNYALFGLASCYRATNQLDLAIEAWERYLELDSSNVTILTRIADTYRRRGHWKRAKELYCQTLDLEPENSYALTGLARVCYDAQEYEEAIKYWNRIIVNNEKRNKDTNIRVLTSLGNCYRKLKRFDEGRIYFEQAYEMEPDNFYALFGLADCYRGAGTHAEALEYLNAILANDPNNRIILTRAGDAYRKIRNPEKAEEYYRRALSLDFDVYAVFGLALLSRQRGDFDAAIETLSDLTNRAPNNYRIYLEIADNWLNLSQPQKALEVLDDFQRSVGVPNPAVSEMIAQIKRSYPNP